jgi:hypothetical protein
VLKVRERGTFWLRRIHLEELSIRELKKKILQKWNDPSKGNIYSVYELWDRNKTPLERDEQIWQLTVGHELEIVSKSIYYPI